MTEDQKTKCKRYIHSAAISAAGIGLAPIPGADLGPICALQVGMIIALGNLFSIPITKDLAKQSAKTFMMGQAGKTLVGQVAKSIPFLGSGINATVAFTLTEALGWEVANEFDSKAEEI